MKAVDADLQGRSLSLFPDRVFYLAPRLLDNLFDPGRMDSAVQDKAAQCQARDLTADGVEGAQGHSVWRIVYDKVDAGGALQGPDVAALPAADAALHFVAGNGDDRYGSL